MKVSCSGDISINGRITDDELLDKMNEAAELCAEHEGLDPGNMEVSLSFVSKEEIHELNKNYRNVDRETDVLSFPLIEDFSELSGGAEILLGDVVICTEKAEEQAEEYGHSAERELVYLFVHSMCHLLGYDHMNAADKTEMRRFEEEIMSSLRLERN